jgi:peroxiredoxin
MDHRNGASDHGHWSHRMTSNPLAEVLQEAYRRSRDLDASSSERLAAFADVVRTMRPSFAEAVDRMVGRLRQSGAGISAPQPGDAMPPFILPDTDGRLVSLEQLLSRGPTAIVFNRGHWCHYCRMNANALVKAHEEIKDQGKQIVAIVPDRQQYARKFKSESKVPFPVLIDIDNGYAISLNLAIWIGAELERALGEGGFDIPRYQGNDAWILPIPATFVVDQDGKVKARFVDPDYRRRMSIADMLKAL